MTPLAAPGNGDGSAEAAVGVGPIPTSRRKLLRKLTSRLEHGFSATAALELRELLGSAEETPAARTSSFALIQFNRDVVAPSCLFWLFLKRKVNQ
jgi:hypothetical protein